MKDKTKEKLSVQSRLLFGQIDKQYGIYTNLSESVSLRKRAVAKIFEIYVLILNPFYKTSPKEEWNTLLGKINAKHKAIDEMVEDGTTVEGLNMVLMPIVKHLKATITTCKINTDELDQLLK